MQDTIKIDIDACNELLFYAFLMIDNHASTVE